MKIRIITLHSIHNFGSVFQALALQKYLSEYSDEVKIIDYRPRYNLVGRNKIRTFVGKFLNIVSYTQKKRKFNSFIRDEMNLTHKYDSLNQLREIYNAKRDCLFIVGGDQLWNPFHYCGNDRAYRLGFLDDIHKKYSYGTSMGKDNFSEDEISPLVQDLHGFNLIGVRELSSVAILQEHGINNVTNVCDPVMLLDAEFYNKYIGKRIIPEKYVFVYLVDKSEFLSEFLNCLKEKYNYKIVHVCGFSKKFECDYMIKNEGPCEVLNLLVNAEIVVSASFHATLFSIIYKKQFYTLLPGKSTNARILDLLELLCLQSRIITSDFNFNATQEMIDYSKIQSAKEKIISRSKIYIKSVLENFNESKGTSHS